MRSFILRLGIVYSISNPLRVYCDNVVAVFLAKNIKCGSQRKHINIKYLAIRKCVKANEVVTEHMHSKSMVTDLLTKGFPPKLFKRHDEHMKLYSFM